MTMADTSISSGEVNQRASIDSRGLTGKFNGKMRTMLYDYSGTLRS